ncbi:probable ethanolamine kinase [Dendronephthya gigantea]|uniref:probable ethanolamine kinase n=1 Tax=Dendronephthya gigantea TaxID=151771 RepID=UPI00106C49F2|nr:probable ethanolamine kinase [Dendronephthya gigantea]
MATKTKRRHFEFAIPFEDSEQSILKILYEIKPEWSGRKLQFKNFTEGISNKLIGCMLQNGSESNLIMFRLYGNQTELFIDRKQELINVEFLHSQGYAPKLYGTFENGYCCGFIPGRTLETEEMSDKHFSELIAKKLARVHAIELPSDFETSEPCVFKMIGKFLSVLPERFEDDLKQERYKKELLSKINVVDELKLLKDLLSEADVPLTYSHNDLLVKNIIYNKDEDKISFIDYEYGAYNFSAFDIGNHFNEFGGVVIDPDYSLYPGREFQMRWLRIYLEEKAKVQGTGEVVTEEQIKKLYVYVNQFALVSHLFWGVWALLQANFSSIDFDFLEYSKNRLYEYLRRKDDFLNL